MTTKQTAKEFADETFQKIGKIKYELEQVMNGEIDVPKDIFGLLGDRTREQFAIDSKNLIIANLNLIISAYQNESA